MFKKVYAFEKWQKCQFYKGQGSKKIWRHNFSQGSWSRKWKSFWWSSCDGFFYQITFYFTSYLRHLPREFRSLTIPQLVVCDLCPPCWPQLGFFASRLCITPLLQVRCHTQGLCKAFRLWLCWAQSSPVQLLSQRLGSREQGNQPWWIRGNGQRLLSIVYLLQKMPVHEKRLILFPDLPQPKRREC